MREELEWVSRLTKANAEDKKRILSIHEELYGSSIHICVNCPDSLRAAVNRLKVELNNRYGTE